MNDKIKSNLLPFQIDHVDNLVRIIKANNAVLDASDTGTGKTYTALATCKILNLKPIIVCPKSVMSSWKRVSKIFKIKPFFIVNYETVKLFKYYNDKQDRIDCPYISENKDYQEDADKRKIDEHYSQFKWITDDDNIIFIFDEVHRASHVNTQNGELLFAAKLTKKPIMILSANVADNPEKFKLFFWILNFIDPSTMLKTNMQFPQYMGTMIRWVNRDMQPMMRIHHMLYPNRASRMRIDALGDLFPETQITAEPYSMGKSREEEIERQYSIIAEELDNLQDKIKKDTGNPLVKIMRAHQKIELLKIPTFVELANDFMETGYSVVIFVNFTQTLKTLSEMLYTKNIIYGQQTAEEREKAIELFQSNKSKIIICNIKAGGVGISLHDMHGKHPRASIISPTYSSIDLTQCLGRIYRAGGKSLSLQRIVYAANTIEEKIADVLRGKLNNLNTINNGSFKDLLTQILKPKIKRENKITKS
jgi:superfamily II DNA or RNA helicase